MKRDHVLVGARPKVPQILDPYSPKYRYGAQYVDIFVDMSWAFHIASCRDIFIIWHDMDTICTPLDRYGQPIGV